MNSFIYKFPIETYFGEGSAKEHLPEILKKYGQTVMLCYGKGSIKANGIYDEIVSILKESGKTIIDFDGIMSNPIYKKVQEGAEIARKHNVDLILAVGGGSVIDCCKVIAAQAKTEKDIWSMEFDEHIFPTEWISMGAIVTASGTGAEMNAGAVITNEEKKIKAGVFAANPDFSILDPTYTMSVPMTQVLSGAFDSLSHCMETYFGKSDCITLSDEIAEAVMRNIIRNVLLVKENPNDIFARSELMWASAMGENGILKIGKTTDFQAHQIEHQLGAYTDCNHGQGLAVIHPPLYRYICKYGAERFARFAREVFGIQQKGKTDEELALAGVEALEDFIKEIGLPTTLAEIGIFDENILKSVADTCNIRAGCCKKLSREEIFNILKECM